jgi:hypothetical protein
VPFSPLSGRGRAGAETAQHVGGADDPDQHAIVIHDEEVMDAQLEHLVDHVGHRRVRRDGEDRVGHDVLRHGLAR